MILNLLLKFIYAKTIIKNIFNYKNLLYKYILIIDERRYIMQMKN